MMRVTSLSYRFADAVLRHSFPTEYGEAMDVISAAPTPLLDPMRPLQRRGVKGRRRKARRGDDGARYFFLPVDQVELNRHLDREFTADGRDWALHPLVVEGEGGPETGLAADYRKNRVQVEVQFGNMARWYTDVFKFQLAYAQDAIDAAILVVPTQRFSNLIDENVAYFERVARELPWAKMSLTLPILVMGIEPTDFAPIRQCYDAAAAEYVRQQQADGTVIVPVPFESRLVEEPEAEGAEEA
jgi:restriction endonuclease BglII